MATINQSISNPVRNKAESCTKQVVVEIEQVEKEYSGLHKENTQSKVGEEENLTHERIHKEDEDRF